MKSLIGAWMAGLILMTQLTAFAADKPTPEAAIALVKKAVKLVKDVGKEKALVEFNDPKGAFVIGELYVFAIEKDGTTVANGSNAKLIGKNTMELRDADGKYFIKAFFDTVATKGSGWVDYHWVNPVSKNIESKTTYVEKADSLVIGCGIYK